MKWGIELPPDWKPGDDLELHIVGAALIKATKLDDLGAISSRMHDAGYKQGVKDTLRGEPYDVDKKCPMTPERQEAISMGED